MRIIISPAKKMKTDTDSIAYSDLPVFLEQTEKLKEWMQSLPFSQQKQLWACSEKIARENAKRLTEMDLRRNLTPAVLAYDGIQYTYMAPGVFEYKEFDYVQAHVRILSGFYGVLKPMDGVVPYRLEMKSKIDVAGHSSLYSFWGDKICREVMDRDRVIINLASKEYSKSVEKYLLPEDRFITCVFGELSGEKVIQKGVRVKMAREKWFVFWRSSRLKTRNA